jgi:hypothetical protein
VVGKAKRRLAVDLVSGADPDAIEVAEHVEARQGDLGGALHATAVTSGDGVEPADTPRAPGGGAVCARVTAPRAQL